MIPTKLNTKSIKSIASSFSCHTCSVVALYSVKFMKSEQQFSTRAEENSINQSNNPEHWIFMGHKREIFHYKISH